MAIYQLPSISLCTCIGLILLTTACNTTDTPVVADLRIASLGSVEFRTHADTLQGVAVPDSLTAQVARLFQELPTLGDVADRPSRLLLTAGSVRRRHCCPSIVGPRQSDC
jgi:hypothetical protein